jgi:hypothetical protein
VNSFFRFISSTVWVIVPKTKCTTGTLRDTHIAIYCHESDEILLVFVWRNLGARGNEFLKKCRVKVYYITNYYLKAIARIFSDFVKKSVFNVLLTYFLHDKRTTLLHDRRT